MEASIDHFCDTHDVPHDRLIHMLNSCLTHIGQNLLFEVSQNKKDASTQTEKPVETTVGELKAVAKKLGLSGYSKLNKTALLKLIEKRA